MGVETSLQPPQRQRYDAPSAVGVQASSQHRDSTSQSTVGHICWRQRTASDSAGPAGPERRVRLRRPRRSVTATAHKVRHHTNSTQLDHVIPARPKTASVLQAVLIRSTPVTLWSTTRVCFRPTAVFAVRV